MRSAFAQVSQPSKASREPCRRLGNSEPEAREPAVESTHTTQHVSHNQASARAPTCLGARQSGPCLGRSPLRNQQRCAGRFGPRLLPRRFAHACRDSFHILSISIGVGAARAPDLQVRSHKQHSATRPSYGRSSCSGGRGRGMDGWCDSRLNSR